MNWTYARARLWLGIVNVGLIVSLAAIAVAGGWPQRIVPSTLTNGIEILYLAAFVIGFFALSLPFDIVGGYILPRRFRRSSGTLNNFANRWATGSLVQFTLLVGSTIAILIAGKVGGKTAALGVVLVLLLGYFAVQGFLAMIVFRRRELDEEVSVEGMIRKKLDTWGIPVPKLWLISNSDTGTTGGIVGLPSRECVLIPATWKSELTDDQLAAIVARRALAISSGSRFAGLIYAVVWNLAGFALAINLPNAGVGTLPELITTCCGFTIWCFAGLLILPTISRKGTFALDAEAIAQGVPKESLIEAITKLDQLQDDEPHRSGRLESVFHPVPCVDRRISMLGDNSSRQTGPWHVARATLASSVACTGLLSRAVHCNAGRPELWILSPTD